MKAFLRTPDTELNRICITCTAPQNDGETIAFTNEWKVILHPDQSGLGSCIVAPLRHVARMADLNDVEWQGFKEVVSELEPALEVTFGAKLVNLSCLKNWAYREHNPDPPYLDGKPNPHVHWHVVPRYESAVLFAGVEFKDPTFGEPFEWRRIRAQKVRRQIIQAIQSELNLEFVETQEHT